MNNLEALLADHDSDLFNALDCDCCVYHNGEKVCIYDFDMCERGTREWLLADVDAPLEPAPLLRGYDEFSTESRRQVADQGEHAETPLASKWRSNDAQKVIPDAEKYKLESNSEGVSHTEDSREKLESDALSFANGFIRKHNGAISWNDELYCGIVELLNRQAEITQDETIHTYNIAAREARKVQEERIAELQEQIAEQRKSLEIAWDDNCKLNDAITKRRAEVNELKAELEAREHYPHGFVPNSEMVERNGKLQKQVNELTAERDYWKSEVEWCMQSAYPPSHSPERAYNPDVMAYPDRHGCTTPSTLVSAIIDGLRDEKAPEYMGLLDEIAKLKEERDGLQDLLRALERELKIARGDLNLTLNNWEQAKGKIRRQTEELAERRRKLDERDQKTVEEIRDDRADYWKSRAEKAEKEREQWRSKCGKLKDLAHEMQQAIS